MNLTEDMARRCRGYKSGETGVEILYNCECHDAPQSLTFVDEIDQSAELMAKEVSGPYSSQFEWLVGRQGEHLRRAEISDCDVATRRG